jgi:hypothetical protein
MTEVINHARDGHPAGQRMWFVTMLGRTRVVARRLARASASIHGHTRAAMRTARSWMARRS